MAIWIYKDRFVVFNFSSVQSAAVAEAKDFKAVVEVLLESQLI
jgi:hypothetical protein